MVKPESKSKSKRRRPGKIEPAPRRGGRPPRPPEPAPTSILSRGGPPGGGRPEGRRNAQMRLEIKEFARSIMEDAVYRLNLLERARDGDLPPQVETTLMHYAYGKPRETVQVEGQISFAALVAGVAARSMLPGGEARMLQGVGGGALDGGQLPALQPGRPDPGADDEE